MVSLPDTVPSGMDPDTGRNGQAGRLFGGGSTRSASITRLLLPGYVKTNKDSKLPLFGYSAVVWKDGGFWVAGRASDDIYKWDPLNFPMDELRQRVKPDAGAVSQTGF